MPERQPHTGVSLPPSLPPSPSLKINKIFKGRKKPEAVGECGLPALRLLFSVCPSSLTLLPRGYWCGAEAGSPALPGAVFSGSLAPPPGRQGSQAGRAESRGQKVSHVRGPKLDGEDGSRASTNAWCSREGGAGGMKGTPGCGSSSLVPGSLCLQSMWLCVFRGWLPALRPQTGPVR